MATSRSPSDASQVALLTAVINNIQDGVLAERDDGRILVANAAFCRIFRLPMPAALIGGSADELRERLWRETIADIPPYRRLTRELRRRRRPQLGFEIPLKDGRVLDRDYVPIPAARRAVVHMWHYRDVTERRQIEKRLRESRRRVRALSAHAEATREEERRRVARTLHDELGQLFSSLKLELGIAINQFTALADPRMRSVVDRLQAAAGLTDIGVASMRSMTMALRPPILDHLGLVPAIEWAASLFSARTGIRTHVRARPAVFVLRDAPLTALYRIVLEALENVRQHAHAGTVRIQLTRRRGVTLVDIRDNGRGITEEQIHNPHTMGLLGMRERALALGGEVLIGGAARRGTRVQVILPDDDPV